MVLKGLRLEKIKQEIKGLELVKLEKAPRNSSINHFLSSHSDLKPNWIEAKQILKFGDDLSTMVKGRQNSQQKRVL